MARKIKIDNAILKRRARKEQKRAQNNKPVRQYYLIVCEGEKTEPNYFEALKLKLPRGVLKLKNIDINGTGKNTVSIIREAKKLRKAYKKQHTRVIDKLWVVFDRDSFPPQNFNNAINEAETSKPKIYCAWTNEAFELWYLLHFNYYDSAITRDRYKILIEKAVNKASGQKNFKYKKNSPNMYDILDKYGDQNLAIKNSKTLEKEYSDKSYANHNPCTRVHVLVGELYSMKNKQ